MANDFDDVRLPVDIERGATGGPGFQTTVITLANGDESRNQEWEASRDKFNIGYGIQKRADMEAVYSFFMARRGRARGFRFRNWLDYQVKEQAVGIVEGEPTQRQLIRPYSDGAVSTYRIVTHPVEETLRVYVNNVLTESYTLEDNGVLVFGADPGNNVKATFEFDIPARFDNDDLNVQLNTYMEGTFPSIQIIELRQ
jgi:uncharacterized protein (TIGR02217 family)